MGRGYDSKLEPYREEIKRLREEGVTYDRIREHLRGHYGVEISKTALFNFVKVRSRPRKVKYRMV